MRKLIYLAFVLIVGIAALACNRKASNELSAQMMQSYDDMAAAHTNMANEHEQMMQEHQNMMAQSRDSLQMVTSTYDSEMLQRILNRHDTLAQVHQGMMQDHRTMVQYHKDVKTQHTSGAMSMTRIQEEREQLRNDHQRILWEHERMVAQHRQAEEENVEYLGDPSHFWRKPPEPDTMIMDSIKFNPGIDTMGNFNPNMQVPKDTLKRGNR